jgi:hypothetical protein
MQPTQNDERSRLATNKAARSTLQHSCPYTPIPADSAASTTIQQPCRAPPARQSPANVFCSQRQEPSDEPSQIQNPKGIPPQSPGLPSLRGYPGTEAFYIHNPEGVAPNSCGWKVHGDEAVPRVIGRFNGTFCFILLALRSQTISAHHI